jgi:hypothetical protein
MAIRTLLVMLLCTFPISCANYDEGYEDGYVGAEKKSYILFGREDYEEGYLNGDFDSWCDYLKETNKWQKYKEQCL